MDDKTMTAIIKKIEELSLDMEICKGALQSMGISNWEALRERVSQEQAGKLPEQCGRC